MDPSIEKRLQQFIQSKGLRNTPQRNAIVEAIFSSDDHFTADDLWERIRKTKSLDLNLHELLFTVLFRSW